jgi:hypothetical protein
VLGDSDNDLDERRLREEVHRGAPPRGARLLTAILPNGRIVWLRVATPLAPAASVNHLADLAENVAQWRQSASHAQSGAIERLLHTVAADADRLDEARLERARAFRRRIVAADNKLDRRLSKAADEFRSKIERQLKIERETVRRLRRRDFWDQIVIATAFPLFAAFGQQGQPFGANNLTLTLSLLIWLVGDDVVEALFGSNEASPYPLRDADAWSYLAPIGNLLAGWWLLGDLQHKRFITGIASVKLEGVTPSVTPHGTFAYQYRVKVDLSAQVAPDHLPDFEMFVGVPAVATFRRVRLSPDACSINARIDNVTATVEEGTLVLSLTAFTDVPAHRRHHSVLGDVEVAWMVDTAQPAAAA